MTRPVTGPGGGSGAGRAAVLGHPVVHSLSPTLHRAAYAALDLPGWTYDAIDIDGDGLSAFLDRVLAERSAGTAGWVGLSLTMPLKRVVRPLLHGESSLAAAVGAVNTVTFSPAGPVGENTDVAGIIAALDGAGVTRVGRAAVLGGGATATSAVAALQRLGCSAPVVHARRYATTVQLRKAADRLGATPRVRGLGDGELAASGGADVVVSTLPGTAADALAADVTAALCRPGPGERPPVLLDVVYAPWPTALARRWAVAGGTVVGGFVMLVHQAAEQVRLMTGRAAPLAAMLAAGEAELARRAVRPPDG